MDLKDIRTLRRAVLRCHKASTSAKRELSDFAEASKTRASESNLGTLDVIDNTILAEQ